MNRHRLLLMRLIIVIGSALVSWLALSRLIGLEQVEALAVHSVASTARASFLYRFDPMSQSFFTIPLSNGAVPIGVAVTGTNPTHVWIAEYGLDRITHVVFTDTANYAQTVYPITSTANSGPYRIAVNGNDVWFTEREANRIGRLDATTGQVDEFYGHGLSPNAGLSDIKVALDGTVWIGGQTVQRLIKLTISSPGVYAFTEFTDTIRPGFSVAPSFLTIDSSDSIWMTMLGAASHTLALYTPGTQSFTWPTLPSGSTPSGIATTPGLVWYADAGRDRLGQISLGTYVIVNEYGPITDALEIAAESANILWLTQQSGQGFIGRFIYTNTASTQYDLFALPTPGLQLAGIATVPGSGVWSVASMPAPYQTFLPLIGNNYPLNSSFGVQLYGNLTAATGFTYAVESKVGWVRFHVLWSLIEPNNTSPSDYLWTNLDVSVQNVQDAGINAIFTIEGNPAWAAATSGGPVYNSEDLQEFVGAVVARYPSIHYWEIYNEPDRIGRFGTKGNDYATLLAGLYPVIKSANPSAQLVFGGVAMDWFTDQGGQFDRNFLRDVLVNCSGICFDIANFHYYPGFRSEWESYGRDIIGKANYVRQILNAHGFNRPLFATETGWPAGTVWGSPELAARYVPKVFARSLAAGLRATVWFAMLDADYSSPGLLDSTSVPGSLIPRFAYGAFQTSTALMTGAKYVGTLPVSSPLEGYQFLTKGKRLDVYWYDCSSMTVFPAQDCGDTQSMQIAATQIAKYDLYGNKVVINDADDGLVDGKITLRVDTNPIYVSYDP